MNIEELTKVQIAFGVATTQTEVDPDRRWDAIKLVSEFLGRLRIDLVGGEMTDDLEAELRDALRAQTDATTRLMLDAKFTAQEIMDCTSQARRVLDIPSQARERAAAERRGPALPNGDRDHG